MTPRPDRGVMITSNNELTKDFAGSLGWLADNGQGSLADQIRQFALTGIPEFNKNDCDDGHLTAINGDGMMYLARRVITRQERTRLKGKPVSEDAGAAYNYVIGYSLSPQGRRIVCILLHNTELAQWMVSGLCGGH